MRMSPVRAPRLSGWACRRGHAFLHAHPSCPDCGERLIATPIAPEARLLAVTRVRVGPIDGPFDLAVAVTRAGARTLCRVETDVRRSGYDAVVLTRRGDLFVARRRALPRS
jgi:uncharacterized OB-fold protein